MAKEAAAVKQAFLAAGGTCRFENAAGSIIGNHPEAFL
jgi:hypothetical protein